MLYTTASVCVVGTVGQRCRVVFRFCMLLPLRTACVLLSSTFWDIFKRQTLQLPGKTYHITDIANIRIMKDHKFLRSVIRTVDFYHEVSVCLLSNARFILFQLNEARNQSRSPIGCLQSRSAFGVPLESTTTRCHPARISRAPVFSVLQVGILLSG